MKGYKGQLVFTLIMLPFLLAIVRPSLALGEEVSGSIGIVQRTLTTHYADYSAYYTPTLGYSTINTWETFSLLGVRGGGQKKFYSNDKFTISAVAGLTIFFSGDYDYEVGIYKGSGGVNFAVEVDAGADFVYQVRDKLSLIGRARVSYLHIAAAEADNPPGGAYSNWWYGEEFDSTLLNLFFAPGVSYKISDKISLEALYRFQIAMLSAWTDYGTYPEATEVSGTGISVELNYHF